MQLLVDGARFQLLTNGKFSLILVTHSMRHKVVKDYKEGPTKWYRMAVDQGNAYSQKSVGVAYEKDFLQPGKLEEVGYLVCPQCN